MGDRVCGPVERTISEFATAVLVDELSGPQLAWLNAYHRHVYETLAPRLTEDEKAWLAQKTAPLTR